MKTKHLFLVTGAIQSSNSKYSISERTSQTINTLKSVKRAAPKVPILYVDAGLKIERNLTNLIKILRIRMIVGSYLDISSDPEVKALQDATRFSQELSNDNEGMIGLYKSHLEVLCYERAMVYIQKSRFKKFRKITKLSGRYELNSNYSHAVHVEKLESSDFVTSTAQESYLKHLDEITSYYQTVLWSGDLKKFEEVIREIKSMLITAAEAGIVIDLEHAMYSSLQAYKVFEIKTLGVSGSPSMTAGKFEC